MIAALHLGDWWASMSEDDRAFIRECCSKSSDGDPDPARVDSPSISILPGTSTASGFLSAIAGWAKSAKKWSLAAAMLEKSIARHESAVDLHHAYLTYVELCELRWKYEPKLRDKCIDLCKGDIALFPQFKRDWVAREQAPFLALADAARRTSERGRYRDEAARVRFDPSIHYPAFSVLGGIYETLGRIPEAIAVYKQAIAHGQDGHGDYSARIARLSLRDGTRSLGPRQGRQRG
jgi:hypothetical protein